jgi:carboxymethylenebutenolidase
MIRPLVRALAVTTVDGMCPVSLHYPETGSPSPAVILYMDGPGIRPAVQDMAARLAASGYAVLLPDLFYRAGPYPPVDPKVVFTDPELRSAHRARYMATATPENVMNDTRAILSAIDVIPEVAKRSIGVVGYCMGGRLALIAAARFPQRIAAAASYHGGGLFSDAPASPSPARAQNRRTGLCGRRHRGRQLHQ